MVLYCAAGTGTSSGWTRDSSGLLGDDSASLYHSLCAGKQKACEAADVIQLLHLLV